MLWYVPLVLAPKKSFFLAKSLQKMHKTGFYCLFLSKNCLRRGKRGKKYGRYSHLEKLGKSIWSTLKNVVKIFEIF